MAISPVLVGQLAGGASSEIRLAAFSVWTEPWRRDPRLVQMEKGSESLGMLRTRPGRSPTTLIILREQNKNIRCGLSSRFETRGDWYSNLTVWKRLEADWPSSPHFLHTQGCCLGLTPANYEVIIR